MQQKNQVEKISVWICVAFIYIIAVFVISNFLRLKWRNFNDNNFNFWISERSDFSVCLCIDWYKAKRWPKSGIDSCIGVAWLTYFSHIHTGGNSINICFVKTKTAWMWYRALPVEWDDKYFYIEYSVSFNQAVCYCQTSGESVFFRFWFLEPRGGFCTT